MRPNRQKRNINRGFVKSKGRGDSKFKSIARVVIVIFVSLSLFWGIQRVVSNIILVKGECTVCNSKLNLLKVREDVKSTMYIFKSPADSRLLGGWLVISNSNLAKTMVVYIPPGVYISDPNELFRSYIQFSDLEYAGKIINTQRSVEYVIWQVENMTGFTVENYVWLDDRALENFDILFGDTPEGRDEEFRNYYLKGDSISSSSLYINSFIDRFSMFSAVYKSSTWEDFYTSVDTNLSSLELIRLFGSTDSQFRAGNVSMVDLSQAWANRSIQDPNGREITVVDYGEYDRYLESNFNIIRSRSVEKEQARVEVYNGSGVAGLASRYARRIQNFGIKVVRYDNSPTELEKTTIYISNTEKFENSFDNVENLVCGSCDVITGRPDFITTGDIIVILGKDKEKDLKWR